MDIERQQLLPINASHHHQTGCFYHPCCQPMDNDNDNFHYTVARPENLTTDNIGNLHQRQQPHCSQTTITIAKANERRR